jgi:hypothetical protein
MRKLNIAYLLAFAPLLMGADNDYGQITSDLIVNSLPKCADNEFLTYVGNGLGCTTIQGGSFQVPSCPTGMELLTFSMVGESGTFSCTPRGTTSLSTGDIAIINKHHTDLLNLETKIVALEKNPSQPAALYCGQTAATKGHFTDGAGAHGLAAAASLCSKISACGPGSRICSVYDMYNSVALGKLVTNTDVTKSWVYMASYSMEYVDATSPVTLKEPGSGQSDNCGGYNYDTGDRKWYGTAVEWKVSATGQYSLQFSTGPSTVGGVNNPRPVPCGSTTIPIACCH